MSEVITTLNVLCKSGEVIGQFGGKAEEEEEEEEEEGEEEEEDLFNLGSNLHLKAEGRDHCANGPGQHPIILWGVGLANKRRFNAILSLIGWAHSQNDPWKVLLNICNKSHTWHVCCWMAPKPLPKPMLAYNRLLIGSFGNPLQWNLKHNTAIFFQRTHLRMSSARRQPYLAQVSKCWYNTKYVHDWNKALRKSSTL